MGLRINENIAALIAQRHLRQNTARLDKIFEQLASGERINRAGDDASGAGADSSAGGHCG